MTLNMTPEKEEELRKKRPWMYIGYPELSRWMASSEEGVVLRRFDKSHARILLRMQDAIVRLEDELEHIDRKLMPIDSEQFHVNGSFRSDEQLAFQKGSKSIFDRRCELLEMLQEKIKEYDKMILRYRTLRSDPEPERAKIENLRTFLTNRGYDRENGGNGGPITDVECEFVNKDGDLLVLVPQTKTPLRKLCKKWTKFLLGRWFRKSATGQEQYEDIYASTRYVSENKVDAFINCLTLILGLALLLIPLQILNLVSTLQNRLNVICGLIALFMVTLFAVMPAKPWETLAATAAYSAVLMVFLQISK